MIGCPTLGALSFATSYDYVMLRAFDLTIPTMKDAGNYPDTQVRETVASLREGNMAHRPYSGIPQAHLIQCKKEQWKIHQRQAKMTSPHSGALFF